MNKILIPKERVKYLLGKDGRTKKLLEDKCGVKLSVSSEGEVSISGDEYRSFFASQVVKAIGRGFSPSKALLLLSEGNSMEIINLKDHLTTENSILRIKGRIIGKDGKMRLEMERLTGCHISVYGHTVSIIGDIEILGYCREAILRIVSGSRHSSVLNYLSKVSREIFVKKLREGK